MIVRLPFAGAHEILTATFAVDPSAVRAAILRAYQSAGGDEERAAAELGIKPVVLRVWVDQLELVGLVNEKWPRAGTEQGQANDNHR